MRKTKIKTGSRCCCGVRRALRALWLENRTPRTYNRSSRLHVTPIWTTTMTAAKTVAAIAHW